jgi:hypothetical protein
MIGEEIDKRINILFLKWGSWLNDQQLKFHPKTTQIFIWITLLTFLFYFILQIFIA